MDLPNSNSIIEINALMKMFTKVYLFKLFRDIGRFFKLSGSSFYYFEFADSFQGTDV